MSIIKKETVEAFLGRVQRLLGDTDPEFEKAHVEHSRYPSFLGGRLSLVRPAFGNGRTVAKLVRGDRLYDSVNVAGKLGGVIFVTRSATHLRAAKERAMQAIL